MFIYSGMSAFQAIRRQLKLSMRL